MSNNQLRLGWIVCGGVALCFSGALWAQCGVERWSIKTGTDANAGSINLLATTPTTIASLVALSAPNPIPVNARVSPTETTVWTIDATLTGFKVEGDSDYHLVIADASGATMIAEIPSPNCVSGTSPFSSLISQARTKFDAAFTPSSSFQDVSVPVRITGIGMFDFLHGQRGVAPNGIELHPVTDIDFNPGSDFSLAPSPGSLSISAGSSGTATLSVNAVGSAGPSVSLLASGTPQGIGVAFAPNPVAPGSSSTATITVDPSASPGSSTVTVTGTAGAISHTAAIRINISSSQPVPDFQFSASPASVAVGAGGSNSISVSVAPMAGFSGEIVLTASGLPEGIAGSFSNATISASGSSVLTIAADPAATAGSAAITITAAGGGMTHTAAVNLMICSGATPGSPSSLAMASRATTKISSFREVSESAGNPLVRDEDDSLVQVMAAPEALGQARIHLEPEICHPHVYALFLGHSWSDTSNLNRKRALSTLNLGITAPVCGGGIRFGPEEVLRDESSPSTLSDLQIQARLVELLEHRVADPPTDQKIYVVFLAPEIRSTLAASTGGRDYFAYENHFHAVNGEIHYILVPFDTDLRREERNASRAVLKAVVTR